jgi:DNA primase
LDSDWDHLSGDLKNGDHIDMRPRSFFYAVKNYKEYMRTMVNLGISVEIWFGHVKENEANAKGIDDLMVALLSGNEQQLISDIDFAMHDKQGSGTLVQLHKITEKSDQQIADLWLLNDPDEFARHHLNEIKLLKEFFLRKFKRRLNEEGKLEMSQKLMPHEQYWEVTERETRSGDVNQQINFNYYNCFNFLQNRGFHRIHMKSNTWDFVHVENRVIHKVDNYAIKDFVTEFTKEIKEIPALNMIYRGGPQYLGHEKLSNLEYIYPTIEKAGRDTQCLFFRDKIWEISSDKVKEMTYSEFKNFVWEDKVIHSQVKNLPPLVTVTPMTDELRKKLGPDYASIPDGEFFVDISDDGHKCHFLQFLKNTSNFTFRKARKFEKTGNDDDAPTMEELFHDNRHLVNKLTAMGYLLHDYKNDSELKAVICMDGRISEVGASNGRTGKSLFGRALEQVIPQAYIPAKNKKITEDNFLYGEVTEKTKNIFLDDVRANIDFEFFFPVISGKLKVNPKGGQPFTLDQEDTPKLLLTTNHAINGEGSSFRDRQAFVAFCDWYNDIHKPIDDFGVNFFSEWEQDQWNLFYNLMATCIQLYFQSLRDAWAGKNKGIVDPPMESLEKRRLRQQIGEDFMTWAEVTFAVDTNGKPLDETSKIGQRNSRKELYDDFLNQHQHARKYVTASSFKKRMVHYCQYKGFHFNINKPNEEGVNFVDWIRHNPGITFQGEADKSGGVEFFTIATENEIMF